MVGFFDVPQTEGWFIAIRHDISESKPVQLTAAETDHSACSTQIQRATPTFRVIHVQWYGEVTH